VGRFLFLNFARAVANWLTLCNFQLPWDGYIVQLAHGTFCFSPLSKKARYQVFTTQKTRGGMLPLKKPWVPEKNSTLSGN